MRLNSAPAPGQLLVLGTNTNCSGGSHSKCLTAILKHVVKPAWQTHGISLGHLYPTPLNNLLYLLLASETPELSLRWVSCESDMGEIGGKGHPEAKFLSSWESVKPGRLYPSQIQ